MPVLQGVKVLDLTRVLAGPYCSMLLADMGAYVIKLENPRNGDDSRAFVPKVNGESAYFMNLNRNKRGITLNLKSEQGKELFLNFIDKVDILLENYRPGTMEKLGVGYDVLSKRNPRLIYGCISGFGHYGPYSQMPGYDIISQAMGGLMSTTGWPDGQPTRSGTAIGDVLGGLNCCIGVLAAYLNCQKTGLGQKVDVALVDSVVSSLEIINQIYLATGRIPERIGNRYEASYPYDSFMAKDGLLVIGAGNDKLFSNLCSTMKMPELTQDPRFITNEKRVQNHKELKTIIEKWLANYSKKEAIKMILSGDCPAAPIYNIAEVVADEHIHNFREMFIDVEHPVAGNTTIAGNQIKFSKDKIRIEKPSPLLGQHNNEVFSEVLGLSEEEIAKYENNGII
jgi:formyl-CoA transferase